MPPEENALRVVLAAICDLTHRLQSDGNAMELIAVGDPAGQGSTRKGAGLYQGGCASGSHAEVGQVAQGAV